MIFEVPDRDYPFYPQTLAAPIFQVSHDTTLERVPDDRLTRRAEAFNNAPKATFNRVLMNGNYRTTMNGSQRTL